MSDKKQQPRTVRQAVDEALQNARANGYLVDAWTVGFLADDLMDHDAEIATMDRTSIELAIGDLRALASLEDKDRLSEKLENLIQSKPRDLRHLDVKDFLTAEQAVGLASSHSAPEPYEGKSAFGGVTTGVLQDRTRTLNLHENPQTLAERVLPIDERPFHYNPGMPASICEVYYPSKSRPTWDGVTCKTCLSLKAKSGRP